MKTETQEILNWYKTRVGDDGRHLVIALAEAIEYIENMMSLSMPKGLEAAHCFNTIRATLVQGREGIEKELTKEFLNRENSSEVTDEEARKILREFFDSIASLDSSVRNLANVIKNKQLF